MENSKTSNNTAKHQEILKTILTNNVTTHRKHLTQSPKKHVQASEIVFKDTLRNI